LKIALKKLNARSKLMDVQLFQSDFQRADGLSGYLQLICLACQKEYFDLLSLGEGSESVEQICRTVHWLGILADVGVHIHSDHSAWIKVWTCWQFVR
jgi:hypothetical protein